MMMFLDALAKYVVDNESDSLSEHCFVFPNRRSGLFFKRSLLKYSESVQWAPRIKTISEFMAEMADTPVSDPLDLLFLLYEIYEELSGSPESFDEFYRWGEMIIHDFDTLDKYMVKPDVVFTNIRELKEIDEKFGGLEKEQVEFIRKFWTSFHQGGDSEEKNIFLLTWNLLPKLYHGLNDALNQLEEGYEGRIYRTAATTEI